MKKTRKYKMEGGKVENRGGKIWKEGKKQEPKK